MSWSSVGGAKLKGGILLCRVHLCVDVLNTWEQQESSHGVCEKMREGIMGEGPYQCRSEKRNQEKPIKDESVC